ncbi:MAG: hypothetical protein NT020_06730 [Chloroflexales bacterium]|nr:hypothetical protein [Chloroflexales bacterium]
MKYIIAFAEFWIDFIVGDDWRIAVAVVVGLAITTALVRLGIPAWWVMPVGIAGYLGVSMTRKK